MGTGNEKCTLCSPGHFYNGSESNMCEACPVGRAANQTGATKCDVCGPGKYTDDFASTACTDCQAGYYTVASTCTPCAAGRSTNGIVGYAGLKCPECKTNSYCQESSLPCGSCETCTIAEYTDGEGATEPSKCMSFGAVFGFRYPTQCIITWLVLGAILLLCAGGLGIKCYIASKSEYVTVDDKGQPLLPDLQQALIENCSDDGQAPLVEARNENEQWGMDDTLNNSGMITL